MMYREEGRPPSVGRGWRGWPGRLQSGALMTTLTAVRQKRSTLSRLGWLARRVAQKTFDDNVFGLSGQLAFFSSWRSSRSCLWWRRCSPT